MCFGKKNVTNRVHQCVIVEVTWTHHCTPETKGQMPMALNQTKKGEEYAIRRKEKKKASGMQKEILFIEYL